MEVNLTLFVQMGNFAIAYVLLRTLLFKPAVAVLHAQEKKLRAAQEALQKQSHDVDMQRQAVASAWQDCRGYFKEHQPQDVSEKFAPFSNITPSFTLPAVDEREYARNQQVLERSIVKKVAHVRS